MSPYVGRFAPSPSGPLHFGSLVCALASFLDAKFHSGKWLVRIDDIDPPREMPGAAQLILNTLRAHGLFWDDEVFYQSQQSARYTKILDELIHSGLAYRCTCNRKRLLALNHIYDGQCREQQHPEHEPASIRLNISTAANAKNLNSEIRLNDRIQGQKIERLTDLGDFIIHRKDGLFAYLLAASADDIAQGISHVVRGYDLFDTAAKQVFLMQLLGATPPSFAHIPVVINPNGDKLSKQNHAKALDDDNATENLLLALKALHLAPPEPLKSASTSDILNWGISHWDPGLLAGIQTIDQQSLGLM